MRTRHSKRWILPLLVVLVWLLVGGGLSGFSGKLSGVQQNDSAQFLPQGAESTLVLEALAEFGTETVPATVVVQRDGGLTDADRAALADTREAFAALEDVAEDGVGQPVLSEDGVAAQVVVQLLPDETGRVTDAVEDVREVLADVPDGLAAHVGGQAGARADFGVAFSAIDGLLLGVALLVVAVILVAVYRSPVLPFVVLANALFALVLASALVYALASRDVITLSGHAQGILFILVVGAATDYALLLVARFREELRDVESKYDAMAAALRGAREPIIASGSTVILGLLCLLLSDQGNLRGLGPVGALGIAVSIIAALTLLPAVLVLLGRRAFWPRKPLLGSEHTEAHGLWFRLSKLIERRARTVWVGTLAALLVASGFFLTFEEGPVAQTDLFLTSVDSASAQEVLDEHFAAEASSPAQVLVPAQHLPETLVLLDSHAGVAESQPGQRPAVLPIPDPDDPTQPRVVDGSALVMVTLADPAESVAAGRTVEALRGDLDEISEEILVGGTTAIDVDTRETTSADRLRVMPAILLVVFLVLAVLLRSIVAPVLLMVANVLSFAAAVGVSAIVFTHVLGFPPAQPDLMLIAFVFLVALGIDYSIFLMTRVREESIALGTRPGVLKGLAVTGGVITSAGIVLAATFAALTVVPLVFLAQVAFIVAFGVLLDALVVRSLLVPALVHDVGRVVWWPSALSRSREPETHP